MKYDKIKLNQEELKQLLKNNNPAHYDHIRIDFDEEAGLEVENFNSDSFKIFMWDEEGYADLKKPYHFKELLNEIVHDILVEGDEDGYLTYRYEDIKRVIVWNYADRTKSDYKGEKLTQVKDQKQLKKFFIDNKQAIKDADFGGVKVRGIGEKKVNVNGEFYSYKKMFDLYKNGGNFMVEIVFKFLL